MDFKGNNFEANVGCGVAHNSVPPSQKVQGRSSLHIDTVRSSSNASAISANADGASSRKANQYPRAESGEDDVSRLKEGEDEIQQLARKFTEESTYSTAGQNPFVADPGSTLDPNSEHFNARAWCKTMLQMCNEDSQAHPLRTVGIVFRNLNVHGFGSDTDYQKTVANVWAKTIGLARMVMSQSRPKTKILQCLDGLVEAGEMLLVLGPPGSGCSTFLKTIAGETDGFIIGKDSNINFQGRSGVYQVKASC